MEGKVGSEKKSIRPVSGPLRRRLYWATVRFRAGLATALEHLAVRINSGAHADRCRYQQECLCWQDGYEAERQR